MLSNGQLRGIMVRMKNFDHIKVADYSLGATYLSKWVYSMHKSAIELKKKE